MMVLQRKMNFIDGSFPAGTPVEVIYDLFKLPDDDRYGIQRTINRRKNFIAVKLGNKYRAVAREDIGDVRGNKATDSDNARSRDGKSPGYRSSERQETVSAINRLRAEFMQKPGK